MKTRNESLQALRGIGFLSVFLYHAGVVKSGGTWGVSLFFILSGFLLMQKNLDHMESPALMTNLRYSLKKIAKLYPLHLFMTLAAVPLFIVRTTGDTFLLRAFKVLLNVTLLQSWFPWTRFRYTMNNLSWFLSVMMFLYFMFPWISRWVGKLSTKGRVWLLLSVWILMVLCGYFFSKSVPLPDVENVLQGLTYNNPIYRLGDFIIGCCVGAIYKTKALKIPYKTCTILETAFLLLSIFFILIDWNYVIPGVNYHWFKPCLYVIPVIPVIVLFTKTGGGVTKTLSKSHLVWLGNISGQAYLIHELVQIYLRKGLSFIKLPQIMYWPILLIGSFIITIFSVIVWTRFESLKLTK